MCFFPVGGPRDHMAASRARGKIKWFDRKKGFGFVEGPGASDVFLHHSNIDTEGGRSFMDEGVMIDFELG